MKKLNRTQLKQIQGGFVPIASCGLKCKDGKFHDHNCGQYGCNTNASGLIDCYNSNGTVVSSNNDPCKGVV